MRLVWRRISSKEQPGISGVLRLLQQMNHDPINFYFLSTGYCGTRFYHHALGPATNAEVWHQPGHEEIVDIVNLMEERFEKDPASFLSTKITEFPSLMRRIDKRLALPWVYGDTLNWMRALGYMLYKYIGPERMRLVQLVRHPVATCRSKLADLARPSDEPRSDLALAEELARGWVRQYSSIQYQFQAINDPAVCRTVRLEDVSLEQIRSLYDFLGLEGFSEPAITTLLTTTTKDIRHSHREASQASASKEELRAVWRLCEPLALQYGYKEEEGYYEDAPSRPARPAPSPPNQNAPDSRPASVKLFDTRAFGLIIRCASGIRYINQAGGPICFWLQAEGSFVPLTEPGLGTPGQRLFEHFHLRRNKDFMSSVKQSDADFIDALLVEHGMGFIKVDRSRISSSIKGSWDLHSWKTWKGTNLSAAPWEAWVPVQVRRAAYDKIRGVLSECEASEAILVWENSN
jgi:hypothetical protein